MHWFYAAHTLIPEDDVDAFDDPAVREKVAGVSMICWRVGIALAVLELLGELPPYEDGEATGAISDFDHWPQIDLDEVYRTVGAFFEAHAEKGVSQQYYPNWVVRRLVAIRVIDAAASVTTEVLNDEEAASAIAGLAGGDSFFIENTRLDEDLELYLARQHLTQLVDAVMRALSAESYTQSRGM
jgi:hypothetical protein